MRDTLVELEILHAKMVRSQRLYRAFIFFAMPVLIGWTTSTGLYFLSAINLAMGVWNIKGFAAYAAEIADFRAHAEKFKDLIPLWEHTRNDE